VFLRWETAGNDPVVDVSAKTLFSALVDVTNGGVAENRNEKYSRLNATLLRNIPVDCSFDGEDDDVSLSVSITRLASDIRGEKETDVNLSVLGSSTSFYNSKLPLGNEQKECVISSSFSFFDLPSDDERKREC
jgi:hypothetical protein